MSFSGTPLGQGRRLDHNTFLNKPPSNGPRATSPHIILPPTSYSYGAPVSPSRSPPKPISPHRDRTNTEDDDDESALIRFARLKQREQSSFANRPGGPKIITSPPKPDKWSVKDTSVQLASAIHAAADMDNPNNSWASGSTRPMVAPRSTSVEYESQVQANIHKRLPAPNRPGQRAGPTRKPPSKAGSLRHVPDSEGEEDRPVNGRGTSPFEFVFDSAKRLKATASFYMQQKTAEPGEPSKEKDSSYDYEAEEREFQNSQATSVRRANNATHKRNRMSTDNRAYKPSQSEEESSDEDYEEDGKTKRRKKKKKKDATGGPLTNLPVISADKRKKRRARGSKGTLGEAEEEEDSGSDDQTTERQSAQRASVPRNSEPPQRQPSIPRGSAPRELPSYDEPDTSMDIEQGLDSIPEVDENELHDTHNDQRQRRSVSRPPSSPSRIGGPLGHLVNFALRTLIKLLGLVMTVLSGLLYFFGQLSGTIFDIIILRPFNWASRAGGASVLIKYVILGLIMSTVYMLRDPLTHYLPTVGRTPVYRAPDVPAANIAELAAQLQRVENALSGLSLDVEKGRLRAENEAKAQLVLAGRLGALENKVVTEGRRAVEAETQTRNAAKDELGAVRQEVKMLRAQIQAAHQQHPSGGETAASDEEAQLKVKALEERVGSVEGGVKEALELGKKALNSRAGPGAAWWNKLASGSAAGSELTIKSSDGQDVTGLIKHLVDSSVSMYSKDTLARPDFALHSGGARVIPSLTSPTFEMRPANLRGQLLGLVTGNGYAIGRPPITALHHEQHQGHCWPFAGQTGQLGVALAAPTYISDVSIDHVAKEVAFDMRSAPREMEVWGMVEGRDNVMKVREWMEERKDRREQARERGEKVVEEPEYPKTLPRAPQYVRIANFKYDIHAPRNVQTFPVDKEVQALGVDFGILVLIVKSNWGRDEYTCLYRFRVHGRQIGETPLPYPEEGA